MILIDGLTLWLRDNYDATYLTECEGTSFGVKNICGFLWLDVNGDKQPNTFGKDIFIFYIMKDRILPHAADDCKKYSNGWGCSNYILEKENMKYIY